MLVKSHRGCITGAIFFGVRCMRTVELRTTHWYSTHDNALATVVNDTDTLNDLYPHNKLEEPVTCYIYVINTG